MLYILLHFSNGNCNSFKEQAVDMVHFHSNPVTMRFATYLFAIRIMIVDIYWY